MQYKSGPEFDKRSIVPRNLIFMLSGVREGAPSHLIKTVDTEKRVQKDVEQQIGASFDEFTKELGLDFSNFGSTTQTSTELLFKRFHEDATFSAVM